MYIKYLFLLTFVSLKRSNHESIITRILSSCGIFGLVDSSVHSSCADIQGMVTDHNLLFYKECTKLLMMSGCLLIIFALSKNESRETEQIRNAAVRNAVFLTFLFVFGGMLWRVIQRDIINVDTSSFLTFLVFNVLCLEFGLQKARVDRFFKR